MAENKKVLDSVELDQHNFGTRVRLQTIGTASGVASSWEAKIICILDSFLAIEKWVPSCKVAVSSGT